MTEEMTVFGHSSIDAIADTMSTTNISSPVDDETITTTASTAINGLLGPMTTTSLTISESNNWSTNDGNSNANVNQCEDMSNPDEELQPIERLEKYCVSDIVFHRQVVVRSLLETLNEVEANDIHRVIGVIVRLSSDTEPIIRVELIDQLPQIGVYLSTRSDILPNAVSQEIQPILKNFLTDTNSQVRKMTQNAFVLMIEQKVIKISFLEEHLCPLLRNLTDFSHLDDIRVEAVGMMSKIVRFLGKHLTEKLLLQTFTRLCLDVSFHVRRICAANFGEVCSVVGQQMTENVLLPRFCQLCRDSIWGVRKSCADVFVPLAVIVSNQIRKVVLSPLFVNLLNDQSRWVKTAAFQSLGPFISTFADPTKTGLYYFNNEIVVVDTDSNDSGCSPGSDTNSPTDIDVDEVEESLSDELTHLSTSSDGGHNRTQHENNEFNGFHFWRDPIPAIDEHEFDMFTIGEFYRNRSQEVPKVFSSRELRFHEMEDLERNEPLVDRLGENDEKIESYKKIDAYFKQFQDNKNSSNFDLNFDMNLSDDQKAVPKLIESEPNFIIQTKISARHRLLSDSAKHMNFSDQLIRSDTTDEFGIPSSMAFAGQSLGMGYMFPTHYRRPTPSQDIIPNDLLEHFLSMTNPLYNQTVDPDLCHYCAYSLPAVALILGRQNWSCLRETYEQLASEMQWKIRSTLASSLHEMSQILGSELTTRDLLPVFLNFTKDLDEVRFGILQNLSQFLKQLLKPQQLGILPKIADFLKMDNDRNWRFRHMLAQQVLDLSHIYTGSQIRKYLLPIGLALLNDKVSEVRLAAIRLISVLVKQIFESLEDSTTPCEDNRVEIILELTARLAESNKWIRRQTYVLVCEQLIGDQSISIELFIDQMLDHLLNLSEDKIPNIRIVLARSLTNTFWPIAQFRSHLKIQQIVEDLQSDKDKDVRNQALSIGQSFSDSSVSRHNFEINELNANNYSSDY